MTPPRSLTDRVTTLQTLRKLTPLLRNPPIVSLPVVPKIAGTSLFLWDVRTVTGSFWNALTLGILNATLRSPAKLRWLLLRHCSRGQHRVHRTGSSTLGALSRVTTVLLPNLITERTTSRGRIIIRTRLRLTLNSYPVLTILSFPPIRAVELMATPCFTI